MIIKGSEKRLFKICVLLGAIALVALVVLCALFPSKGYAANPIAKAESSHNHVTFGDVYFDGFTQNQFHTDTYYNGYTNTGVTSGAGVFEIAPGKFRHATEMTTEIGGITCIIASGTATNSKTIFRREYFQNQIWASAYPQAIMGVTVKSTHYVTYNGSTKSMGTNCYLRFDPSWPLPFSDDRQFETMSGNKAVIKGEYWIPVVATNGEFGIVKKDQYEYLINESLKKNSTEAVEDLDDYNTSFSAAIASNASDVCSTTVSAEEIKEILQDDVIKEEELAENTVPIAESIQDLLGNNLSDADVIELLDTARYSTGAKIPVYDLHGETVIGEFVLDLK